MILKSHILLLDETLLKKGIGDFFSLSPSLRIRSYPVDSCYFQIVLDDEVETLPALPVRCGPFASFRFMDWLVILASLCADKDRHSHASFLPR